jgi:hypothetical protein
MRQINKGASSAPLSLIKYYLITALMLLTFIATQAHASGAKMPTVTDSTGSTGTGSDTGITEETTNEPGTSGTTTPTTPTPPVVSTGTTISDKYSHLDPNGIVPKSRLAAALKYYDANPTKVKNKEFIAVIDFSQHSSKERFYIINMTTGDVETFQTAHGKGSDPDYDGYAQTFSNVSGSNASSQGVYVTGSTYEGSHGYSLLLDGMSSTNSNARSRAIVIHPADYVVAGQKAGRSWGCPALDPHESVHVIDELKNGAVIYAE